MVVKDIMREPVVVKDTATFIEVLETMICKETNSVLVTDDEGVMVGEVGALSLIREVVPDYLEKDAVAAHFATEEIFWDDVDSARDVPVSKFIYKDIQSIHEEGSLMKAAVVALAHGQSRIPVLDKDNKPVGVLTRTELKKVIGEHFGIAGCFHSEEKQ